jgi:hypothetical protein
MKDVLLKPGIYFIMLWMGRGALEQIDYIEDAGAWDMHEPPTAKHTETFPGVYQCRFTHDVEVVSAGVDALAHAKA